VFHISGKPPTGIWVLCDLAPYCRDGGSLPTFQRNVVPQGQAVHVLYTLTLMMKTLRSFKTLGSLDQHNITTHNTQTLSNTIATNDKSVLSASCEHASSYCTWRQNVRASLGRLWAFCWRYVCRRIFTASCVFLSINLAMCVKCAKRNCSGNHSTFPTKVTAGICKPQTM